MNTELAKKFNDNIQFLIGACNKANLAGAFTLDESAKIISTFTELAKDINSLLIPPTQRSLD